MFRNIVFADRANPDIAVADRIAVVLEDDGASERRVELGHAAVIIARQLAMNGGSQDGFAVVQQHAVQEDGDVGGLGDLFVVDEGRFKDDVVSLPLAGLTRGVG